MESRSSTTELPYRTISLAFWERTVELTLRLTCPEMMLATMSLAVPTPLSLEQFLRLSSIEESPAWEFICGEAIQKPMPGGKHSRLQSRLVTEINAAASLYEALPELRCTFGGKSIVPDLAVVARERIPAFL